MTEADEKLFEELEYFFESRSFSGLEQALADGADINARGLFGLNVYSLLEAAIIFDSVPLFNFCITHKADINNRDGNLQTPLMLACVADNGDFISLLIKAGANVNLQDENDKTALHFAVQRSDLNHVEYVEQLVAAGADFTLRDASGQNAEDVALERNNIALVNFFKQCRFDSYRPEKTVADDLFDEKGLTDFGRYLTKDKSKIITFIRQGRLSHAERRTFFSLIKNNYSASAKQEIISALLNRNLLEQQAVKVNEG